MTPELRLLTPPPDFRDIETLDELLDIGTAIGNAGLMIGSALERLHALVAAAIDALPYGSTGGGEVA